jgi:sialate O-acetylesterase
VFDRVEVADGALRVWFSAARGLRSRCPDGLEGFQLAGSDGCYHPARAVIDGEQVVVSSPAVAHPVHVRYAFTDTGEGDLENGAGLPALSFRTDSRGEDAGTKRSRT